MCVQSVKDRTIKNEKLKKKGKVELGNWEQKVRILGTGHGAEPGVSSSVEQGMGSSVEQGVGRSVDVEQDVEQLNRMLIELFIMMLVAVLSRVFRVDLFERMRFEQSR